MNSFEARLDRLTERFLETSWVIRITCLVLVALFLSNMEADPDLFARLAAGKIAFDYGGVALNDPFAFTKTKTLWIDHEWLSGVVFYFVLQTFGEPALFLFKVTAVFFTMTILYRGYLVGGGDRRYALLWLLIAGTQCAYLWVSTVRSQVFTYLFLPLYLIAFFEFEKGRRIRSLWLLPPAMFIWTNAHGGFVVGLGLFFIYLVSALVRMRKEVFPLLVSFLLCVGATLLTPYPPNEYWGYILDAVTMSRPAITEWAPLGVFSLSGVVPNLLVLLIAVGAWLNPRPRGEQLTRLALLFVSAVYGYKHERLVGIFIMTALVAGAPYLNVVLSRIVRPKLRRAATIFVAISIPILAVFVASEGFRTGLKPTLNNYPEKAFDWLKKNRAGGNLLVDFNNGSYALWTLHPKFQISMDGRYEEVYPSETVDQVAIALSANHPNHVAALAEIKPDLALLRKIDRGFGPDWSVIYEDQKFKILEP